MSRCYLARIEDGSFRALKTGALQVEVREHALACCDNRGYLEMEGQIYRCPLPKRLRRINTFYRKIFQTLDEITAKSLLPEALQSDSKLSHEACEIVQSILKRPSQFRFLNNKSPQPSRLLWTLGIMLQWYTDIQVDIFDQTRTYAWIPEPQTQQVILVSGVSKLYDSQTASCLDSLVQRAYSYNAALFVELTKEHASFDENARKSFNHQGFVKERLGYLKNKDPLSYLSGETRSKIKSMEI